MSYNAFLQVPSGPARVTGVYEAGSVDLSADPAATFGAVAKAEALQRQCSEQAQSLLTTAVNTLQNEVNAC